MSLPTDLLSLETDAILAKLISHPSVTPEDAKTQDWMMRYLSALGFHCTPLNRNNVSNFFASFGKQGPMLVFAGHTDVVPPGSLDAWATPPYQLVKENGFLYGRGVADMKGALAAMLIAAKRFVQEHEAPMGRLGFLITSGEEGNDFMDGTPHVMSYLAEQGIRIDYCLVGEPSSQHRVGDMLKIGRRGSLTGYLEVFGKQGHVAYPHLAQNPIHLVTAALQDIAHLHLDEGNQHFPPSSLQITSIQSGGEAGNIIPGKLSMQFNIRFSTEQHFTSLKDRIEAILQKQGLQYSLNWQENGLPFLTEKGLLLDSTIESIRSIQSFTPELSTSGGTSDGRFIAPYGVEVIELGLCNDSIHQVNERIRSEDLDTLTELYYQIIQRTLVA